MNHRFVLAFLCAILGSRRASASATQPLNVSSWANKTVLLIGAHPDDIEAFAGGVLARLNIEYGANANLVYLITTNGDKGCTIGSHGVTPCENITSSAIAKMRQKEAQEAAAVMGAKLVMLKGYDDGMLYSYDQAKIRKDITLVVRQERPDIVVTWKAYPDFSIPSFNGWGDIGFHTDHQDTARHVLDVIRNAAHNKFTFPDIPFPSLDTPVELYLADFSISPGQFATRQYICLTEPEYNKKIVALSKHKSQYTDMKNLEQIFGNLMKMTGEQIGDDCLLAEAFVQF